MACYDYKLLEAWNGYFVFPLTEKLTLFSSYLERALDIPWGALHRTLPSAGGASPSAGGAASAGAASAGGASAGASAGAGSAGAGSGAGSGSGAFSLGLAAFLIGAGLAGILSDFRNPSRHKIR